MATMTHTCIKCKQYSFNNIRFLDMCENCGSVDITSEWDEANDSHDYHPCFDDYDSHDEME